MLDVSRLSVSYGKHLALDDVALSVGEGEIVVMLGANGAGKSSCLKALGGDGSPAASTRTSLWTAPTSRPCKRTSVVEAGLALVPEDRGIFPDLTVRENLQLGAFANRARARESENLKRVLALFPRLGERMGQYTRTMSGGERQMVAIGRALMSNPQVLLLDEPSLGLSPLVCKELFQALSRIKEHGCRRAAGGAERARRRSPSPIAAICWRTAASSARGRRRACRTTPPCGRRILAEARKVPTGTRKRRTAPTAMGMRLAGTSIREPLQGPPRNGPQPLTPPRKGGGELGRSSGRGIPPIQSSNAKRPGSETMNRHRPDDQQRRREGHRQRHLRPDQPDDGRGRHARGRRHGVDDARRAVDAAAAAFPAWSEMAPAARRALLNKAADLLEAGRRDGSHP